MLCFYYKQIMKICAGLNFPTKVKVRVATGQGDDMLCCRPDFSRGHGDGPGGRLLNAP